VTADPEVVVRRLVHPTTRLMDCGSREKSVLAQPGRALRPAYRPRLMVLPLRTCSRMPLVLLWLHTCLL